MRKTWDSRNSRRTLRLSFLAEARSVPNGFSMTIRTSAPLMRSIFFWPSCSTITGKNCGAVER